MPARWSPARGTVAGLWRWPVKSMAGERVNALRLDLRGAGGDRTHAVLTSTRASTSRSPRARRRGCWRGRRRTRSTPAAASTRRARRSRSSRRPTATPTAGATRACGPGSRTTSAGRCSCCATSRGSRTCRRTLLVTTQAIAGRARRGARRPRRPAPVPAPTCTSTSTRAAWAELAGKGPSWRSRAASGCGCCTRASAARSRPGIPTRRSSGRACSGTSRRPTTSCFGINARVLTGGRLAAGEDSRACCRLQVSAATGR